MKNISIIPLLLLTWIATQTGCVSPAGKLAFSPAEYSEAKTLIDVGYADRKGFFEFWSVTVTNPAGCNVVIESHPNSREVTIAFADEAKPRAFFDSMVDYNMTPKGLRQSTDLQFIYLIVEGLFNGTYEDVAYVYDIANRTFLGNQTINAFCYPQ
ncbi:MAG: hypothetical protein EOM20_08330 [Spartobacteria bacterium]|nr:hypothetical protein [Spartobacteria bacterium]